MDLPTFHEFVLYVKNTPAKQTMGVAPSDTENPLALWLKWRERRGTRRRVTVDYLHVCVNGVTATTPVWMVAVLARLDNARGPQPIIASRLRLVLDRAEEMLEKIYGYV